MSADEHQPVEPRSSGRGLGEAGAAGAGHEDRAPLAGRRLGENRVQHAGYRSDPHHHSGPAAERDVVGALAAVQRIQQVMVSNVDEPRLYGRPTIESPTKGANISGKSVSTSIVNIG